MAKNKNKHKDKHKIKNKHKNKNKNKDINKSKIKHKIKTKDKNKTKHKIKTKVKDKNKKNTKSKNKIKHINKTKNTYNQDWLKYFPITMFAIIMGVGGLAIAYQRSSVLLHTPQAIGDILVFVNIILFGVISVIYVAKIIIHPSYVEDELNHPVKVNFFAAFSISLLLLSIIYKQDFFLLSSILWYIGSRASFVFYHLHS